MLIKPVDLRHPDCGGDIIIAKLFATDQGCFYAMGRCEQCNLPVSMFLPHVPVNPAEFNEQDEIRLHGMGIAYEP